MPEFQPLPAPTTTLESYLHGVCARLDALLEQGAPKAKAATPRATTASDGAGAKPAAAPRASGAGGKGTRARKRS